MKNNTIRIIVVLTCIIGSFFLGWKCALRKSIINTTPQTIVETVVQYDTTKIESVIYTPIPYKEIEYRKEMCLTKEYHQHNTSNHCGDCNTI